MESGNLQYYCINFNELKPRKWMKANDFPDDQAEFEYWINVAKNFTDISLEFLSNNDFSLEVIPEFESKSQSNDQNNCTDNITGIEGMLANIDNKILFIPEIDSIKDVPNKDINNKLLPKTTKSINPNIHLQYFYDQTADSINSQSESESIDFTELEEAINPEMTDSNALKTSETNDILQVILPTYSIEKRAYDEENDLFVKNDLIYAEIAEGVSKRYVSQDSQAKIRSKKNTEEYMKKVIEKKKLNNSINLSSTSSNISNNNDNPYQNQVISIKNCFKVDEIIFFVVEMKSKNDDDRQIESKNPQTICIPENVMKKHFPNILIDYFEKNIVFN